LETAASLAVTTALQVLAMVLALAVNAAVVAPAVTATEVGTESSVLFEARDTAAPPVGAAALRVTVQVAEAFDARLAAPHCSADRAAVAEGAVREMAAVLETPL
jgi:hypothetical protein